MPVLTPKHILISRTDGIGDVILTLPLAGALKSHFPDCEIGFLGRSYTKEVVACCKYVDHFYNWDEVAQGSLYDQMKLLKGTNAEVLFHVFPRKQVVTAAAAAKIPVRIGTARRAHAFFKMTHRLWYSRKDSDLHEAQLNLKMLEAIGIDEPNSDQHIADLYGFSTQPIMNGAALELLQNPFKIMLHPMSHGSAVEWPLERYAELIELLAAEGVAIGISGTEKERQAMGNKLPWNRVVDLGGRLDLKQLISTIGACNGLVAASTGPLHIAAAAGIPTLGLYSPKRPIHPIRWRPIGAQASYLEAKSHPQDGKLTIQVEEVADRIREWKANF